MKILKYLLYPFAVLFDAGTRFRNHLYDIGQKPSFEFTTTVISVGNLSVGGAGKTPMVEYLIGILSARCRVATLSRGYGRASIGYRQACVEDSARSVGDEPMQLFRKFGSEVNVFVSEDRVFAIPHILQAAPDTKVIILDDALQHRRVKPHLSILVTDFAKPFYEDFLMPLGRLREGRRGAKRADIIVITKCPATLQAAERKLMTARVRRYAGEKPVFFSNITYDEPVQMGGDPNVSSRVVLVTGIARTEPLVAHLQSQYQVVKHFRFPDHHAYTDRDLESVLSWCRQQAQPVSIFTTEKDMVRLLGPEREGFLKGNPWFYVPIRHSFMEDGPKFDAHVVQAATDGSGTL